LCEGGSPGQCGWLKDRYGVSWQIVPTALIEMMKDKDPTKVRRVTEAMLPMTKPDIGALRKAYNSEATA
jgi:predicted 3-demethylubiquinone-9 3-methyltransferase (glyoxalase superfamily)